MGRQSIREYFRSVYAHYRQAAHQTKRKILDEFCANTKYNRKYALRLLNGPPAGSEADRAGKRSSAACHPHHSDLLNPGRSGGHPTVYGKELDKELRA
jgi:hypothetical protein